MSEPLPLLITYTNWRGETRERRVLPKRVFYGSNEWHPDPQWLMEALDCETLMLRTFAMQDMAGRRIV